MQTTENRTTITAVVPAYNEAERIGNVLDVLTSYPGFEEIIVVNDGSTDHTEAVVRQYPVRHIKNTANLGKGQAMDIGVNQATSNVIFFTDADVSGLTHAMIHEITEPVLSGKLDMFIGMRSRKLYILRSMIVFVPLVGGERAVTKDLWKMLPEYYKHRFRIEPGLNFYAQYYGKGFQYTIIKGLKQTLKEKKYGFVSGMTQRLIFTWNVISAQFKLQFVDIPKSAKNRRLSTVVAVQSLLGMTLGAFILIAVYMGPNHFVSSVFAEELREDPTAPFARYMLYVVNVTAVSTLAIIGGVLLTVNVLGFSLTFKQLRHLFDGITNKIKNGSP